MTFHLTPYHSRYQIENLQHKFYSKMHESKAGRIRWMVVPIALLSITAPFVKRIAQIVEAVVLMVINLVGSLCCKKKCTVKNAYYCFKVILWSPLDFIIDSVNAAFSGAATLTGILIAPKFISSLAATYHAFMAAMYQIPLHQDKPTILPVNLWHFRKYVYDPSNDFLKGKDPIETWTRKIYRPVDKENLKQNLENRSKEILGTRKETAAQGKAKDSLEALWRTTAAIHTCFQKSKVISGTWKQDNEEERNRLLEFTAALYRNPDFNVENDAFVHPSFKDNGPFKALIHAQMKMFFENEKGSEGHKPSTLEGTIDEMLQHVDDKLHVYVKDLLFISEKLKKCLPEKFDHKLLEHHAETQKILLQAARDMAKPGADVGEIQKATKEKLTASGRQDQHDLQDL